MTNIEIAQILRNVAASYSIKNEKKFYFQLLAYQKAAEAIESSSVEVEDLIKEKRLNTVPGIGPTIQMRLEELCKTGKVKHFEEVMQGIPQTVFELMKIPSFGPKKAYKLVSHFKLEDPKTGIAKLEQLAKQGKIRNLEGFGEKSESDILRAIGEFRKGVGKVTRMVLPFAAEVAEQLINYLKKSKDILDAQPLGSLRRMMPTIGDIDIGVATKNPKAALSYFTKYPYKERVIEQGPTSASIIASGGKQIDVIALEPSRFGSLLQHFTGSKNHNVKLREYALRHGMSLSERGIKRLNPSTSSGNKKEEIESYNTEEKFYKALGLDWIPPEIREDKGEIELALKHNLLNLIKLKDIKGDFHIHSSFPIEPSHDLGGNPIEEMVKRAIELGYTYIGFSEHNPSVSKHTKAQIYNLVQRRNNEIDKVQQKHKDIKILKLMETDILANGQLALDDKTLELLDFTIVSIHSVFAMERKKMTKRVLSGLSHAKAKLLAHPTGRLLNNRAGYDLDWNELFEFCKKNNKALEINAWPERLDLPDPLVFDAVKQGIMFSIDTDSHAIDHMNLMKYGVSVARRGWATKHDIINCLEYNKLIQWIGK